MNMARTIGRRQNKPARLPSSVFALLLTGSALSGKAFGAEAPENFGVQKLDPRLQRFFAAKERHGGDLAKELKLDVAPEIWDYFDAGVEGDWATVRKLWRNLSNRSGQYSRGVMDDRVRTVVWSPLLEAELG